MAEITPQSRATGSGIHRLPYELLSKIFEYYHEYSMGHPARLSFVCRNWHNVAASTSSLWSNILFCSPPMLKLLYESDISSISVFHACTSPEQLVQAFRRLGPSSTFHLMYFQTPLLLDIPDGMWDDIGRDVLRRCRTLGLYGASDDGDRHPFHNLVGLEVYVADSLEESRLHVLREAVTDSPRLKDLMVAALEYEELNRHRNLLERLEKLSLGASLEVLHTLQLALTAATSLKQLTLEGPFLEPASLEPSSKSLTDLELKDFRIHTLAASAYRSLIGLEIVFTQAEYWSPLPSDVELSMPLLEEIFLDGAWGPLRYMVAPKIKTMRLRTALEPEHERIAALGQTKLRPSILRLTLCVASARLLPPFRRTLRDISELHIALTTEHSDLDDEFVEALAPGGDDDDDDVICPKLRCLTILWPFHTAEAPDVIPTIRRRAGLIAKGRLDDDHLELLRYGWMRPSEKIRGDVVESWWMQEWVDLV